MKIAVLGATGRTGQHLDRLLSDADAVVSALGPAGKQPRLHRETAAALIPAMQRHGIRRYVDVEWSGNRRPG